MEIAGNSACDAFISTVEKLVVGKRLYSLHVEFPITPKDTSDDRLLAHVFDYAFEGKEKRKGGVLLSWRNWLINSGFPNRIYLENDKDLLRTINDPRILDKDFSKRATTNHNFFGRMCRPLPSQKDGKSFGHYLIERWDNPDKKHRNAPYYYFDIEPAEFIWEEMVRNPKQIKTGRSGAICATNMWFRWNVVGDRMIVGWILKHCEFTHFYQDIYSPQLIARALCKHFGCEYKADISVFFCSISMDDTKVAQKILKGWYNKA